MNISRDEARLALEAVREVEERTRRALSMAGGGPILMIWGVVWLIGYLGSYVLVDARQGAVWAVLDTLGAIGTLWVVYRNSRRLHDPVGSRIGLLWLFLILYGGLWIWIARPEAAREAGFMAATIAMFGYVVLGLWLDKLFMWIGLAVTALSIAGYLLMPDAFELWMGVLGGGTLFASGAYIHHKWR